MTNLGILSDVTEGNVWTPLEAVRHGKNGYGSRYRFTLAGVNHVQVSRIGSAL